MGFDPDDPAARRTTVEARYVEWHETWEAAATEVGYHEAWEAWNSASEATARVGEEIFKIAPKMNAGLLVRLRVIEEHDDRPHH